MGTPARPPQEGQAWGCWGWAGDWLGTQSPSPQARGCVYEFLNVLLQFLETDEEAISCKHLIPQKLPKSEFHSHVPLGGQSAGNSVSLTSYFLPKRSSASTHVLDRKPLDRWGDMCTDGDLHPPPGTTTVEPLSAEYRNSLT